jgi:hypothetical protein
MAKRKKRKLLGARRADSVPDWRPLFGLSPGDVLDFMWMHRVDLADGTVVEAYKHWSTRKYIYLDASGRGYELVGDTTFEEGDAMVLLVLAIFHGDARTDNIVRQNDWADGENITWARSYTRHRISRGRTLFAITSSGICFEDGSRQADELRLYFFGDDQQGRPLEILALEGKDGGLLVIHSMRLRARFMDRYKEALRWQR